MKKIGLILGYQSEFKSGFDNHYPAGVIRNNYLTEAQRQAKLAIENSCPTSFANAGSLLLLSFGEPYIEGGPGKVGRSPEYVDQLMEREFARVKVRDRKPLAPEVIAKRIYDRVMSRKVAVE